jgi:glutamine amidotransferase
MIAIVDYGLGNVRSVLNMLRKAGHDAMITGDVDAIDRATKIILPGVGSFDAGMRKLDESGLRPLLEEHAMTRGTPVLGICLGMQLLARTSEEGSSKGLGWIDADVVRLTPVDGRPLPHMGWTTTEPTRPSALFPDFSDELRFYYLHSYVVAAAESDTLATADYGVTFTSAIGRDNLCGVQFHPEKSHRFGLAILRNFATQ